MVALAANPSAILSLLVRATGGMLGLWGSSRGRRQRRPFEGFEDAARPVQAPADLGPNRLNTP
jgi:hypothetical protein